MFPRLALLFAVPAALLVPPAHAAGPSKPLPLLRADHAEASSYLQTDWNRFTENYHPSYALDGDPKTAWVEGAEGLGVGASMTVPLSPIARARRLVLRVRNGYQKSKALFAANAAPKVVRLALLSGDGRVVHEARRELKRAWGWQSLELDVPEGRGFSALRLTIEEAWPGKKYLDTCLSDLEIAIDSDLPYDAAAEGAKHARLKAWIAERVKAARFFAKKPPSYPFAATHFDLEEPPVVTLWRAKAEWLEENLHTRVVPGFVVPRAQLATGTWGEAFAATFEAEDRAWLQALLATVGEAEAKLGPRYALSRRGGEVPVPDGVYGASLELWLPFLHPDGRSFFETRAEHVDRRAPLLVAAKKGGSAAYLAEAIEKWWVGHPRVEWADAGAQRPKRALIWEHKIVEERGVYQSMRRCLLGFDGAGRLERIGCVADGDDGHSVESIRLGWDGDGKLATIDERRAEYTGPESPESDGEHVSYQRVLRRARVAVAKR